MSNPTAHLAGITFSASQGVVAFLTGAALLCILTVTCTWAWTRSATAKRIAQWMIVPAMVGVALTMIAIHVAGYRAGMPVAGYMEPTLDNSPGTMNSSVWIMFVILPCLVSFMIGNAVGKRRH